LVLVPPPPRAAPGAVKLPGMIVMRFVPVAMICAFDRGLRTGAQGHHRDDRGHADDHAEHGQGRSQLVAAQRLEGDSKRH
jgi:hypothetical protein